MLNLSRQENVGGGSVNHKFKAE